MEDIECKAAWNPNSSVFGASSFCGMNLCSRATNEAAINHRGKAPALADSESLASHYVLSAGCIIWQRQILPHEVKRLMICLTIELLH